VTWQAVNDVIGDEEMQTAFNQAALKKEQS